MSQFEFILITYAIIVGFGVAQILANLGEQLRQRHDLPMFHLQVAGCVLILLALLSWLWGMWLLRGVEWTFPGYLGLSSVACVLALAAHLMKVEGEDKRGQYYANAKIVYPLIAITPFFAIAMSYVVGVDPLVLPRTAFSVFILSLAFVQKDWFHWSVIGVVLVSALVMVSANQFGL